MFRRLYYVQAHPNEITSFVKARDYIHQFEQILNEWNIKITHGSELENICLLVQDMEDRRLGTSKIDTMEDIRPIYRKSCGLIEFVRTFVHSRDKENIREFIPHLALLNNAKSAGAQNVRVLSDDASNKVFELYVALICIHVGKDVELAPPNDLIGSNPDVLVNINGRKWGFACKVMNGKPNSLTLFGRWEEAAKQIQKSPAEIGCTFFNFRNWIDHDVIWPILNLEEYRHGAEPVYGATTFDVIAGYLQSLANNFHNGFINENGDTHICRVLQENPKALPGILAFMQSSCSTVSSIGPIPTTIGVLSIWPFKELNTNVWNVLKQINNSLHHRF